MAARRPHLVYCSISGCGRTSPLAARAGFDPVLRAESWTMSITGEPVVDPLRHPVAMVDTVAVLYAGSAILAALGAHPTTGRGRHIDLALFDCSVATPGNAAQWHLRSGQNPVRMGNTHPAAIPVGLFRTRTGPMCVACGTDRPFDRLCREARGGPTRIVASPHRFLDTPVARAVAPTLHGQHTDEILRDVLGYDEARIAELRASGVGGPPSAPPR